MTTWNSTLYTGQTGSAGASLNASSSFPMAQKESGKLRYSDVTYALNGNESANDIINIVELKPGAFLVPSLCRIVCEDPGTALTLDIGDAVTADRYMDGGALTTAHDTSFTAAPSVTATAAWYTPYAIVGGTTPTTVIKAKVITATALTAAAKVRFLIAWQEP